MDNLPEPYYQHGGQTIYHGDCREILPLLDPVDLVLTDPPYAVSVKGSSVASTTAKGGPNGRRSLDFFEGDTDWAEMRRTVAGALASVKMTGTASAYVWCGHRSFGDVVDLYEAAGFSTRPLGWHKIHPAPGIPGSGWTSALELCVYAYRPGRTWNAGSPDNVLRAQTMRPGQPDKTGHPTQKPIHVIEPLVRFSSCEGDTVLDPFMGSGTTLRAAKDLGRRAIGIEIKEEYAEMAARRLAQEVLPFEESKA